MVKYKKKDVWDWLFMALLVSAAVFTIGLAWQNIPK